MMMYTNMTRGEAQEIILQMLQRHMRVGEYLLLRLLYEWIDQGGDDVQSKGAALERLDFCGDVDEPITSTERN